MLKIRGTFRFGDCKIILLTGVPIGPSFPLGPGLPSVPGIPGGPGKPTLYKFNLNYVFNVMLQLLKYISHSTKIHIGY